MKKLSIFVLMFCLFAGMALADSKAPMFWKDCGTGQTCTGCSLDKETISYYPLNEDNSYATLHCYITDYDNYTVTADVKGKNGNIITGLDVEESTSYEFEAGVYADNIAVDGSFTIEINAVDEYDNEASYEIEFTVDGTAPETIIALDKKENNINPVADETNIKAVIRDITSNVVAAELLIGKDNIETNFNGQCKPDYDNDEMYNEDGSFVDDLEKRYDLEPLDGDFDSGLEEVVATIPYEYGDYCIFIHGKDAAGNWEQTYGLLAEGTEENLKITVPDEISNDITGFVTVPTPKRDKGGMYIAFGMLVLIGVYALLMVVDRER